MEWRPQQLETAMGDQATMYNLSPMDAYERPETAAMAHPKQDLQARKAAWAKSCPEPAPLTFDRMSIEGFATLEPNGGLVAPPRTAGGSVAPPPRLVQGFVESRHPAFSDSR